MQLAVFVVGGWGLVGVGAGYFYDPGGTGLGRSKPVRIVQPDV